MTELEFKLLTTLRIAKQRLDEIDSKASYMGDWTRSKVNDGLNNALQYTELCWECTGSGIMGDGYPCKVCRAEGILPSEDKPTPTDIKLKIMGSFLDSALDDMEVKFSQDPNSFSFQQCNDYITAAQWCEVALKRKDHCIEAVRQHFQQLCQKIN